MISEGLPPHLESAHVSQGVMETQQSGLERGELLESQTSSIELVSGSASKDNQLLPLTSTAARAVKEDDLKKGDRVMANYKGEGTMYPGKIALVNLDSTFDITYDDGDKELRVPKDRVRAKTIEEKNQESPLYFLYCCAALFLVGALCLLFTSCPVTSPGINYCTTSLWSQVAGTLSKKEPGYSSENGCFMRVSYNYGGMANITYDRNNTMHYHGYTGGGSCTFSQIPSTVMGNDYNTDNKECDTMNNWYNQHRLIGSTQTIFVSKYDGTECHSTSTMSDLFWVSIAFFILASLTLLRAATCSASTSPTPSTASSTKP